MTRPVMLLDVDGVLNPFGASTCPDGYLEHEFYPGEGPERYCPGHGAWIAELTAAGDVHWASAWGEDANTLLIPLLGIDPLPVVPFPPLPFKPEDKVPAIAAAAGDRPAAWIDDNHTDAGRRWAAGRAAPTLLVSIDSAIGWTRDDVDRVLAWAREL
ncbi:hypothetical protein [Actinoplanes sp. NPDC049316]|uniref:hypothetical protein n=1 Tax=Actinoplanes sp. NPDC049316 TaxID=3154727 RepID=UPI00342BCACD